MSRTMGFTSHDKIRCLEDVGKDSVDLNLAYCGWERCDPEYRFGPNKREAYVIHVVKEGKGTLEINKRTYHLGAEDAFLIIPGQEAWYEADAEEPWTYLWLGFVGLKAEECVREAGFSLQTPVRRVHCLDKLNQYMDQILDAHQLTYGDEMRRNALMMMCFAELSDDYQKSLTEGGISDPSSPGAVYVKSAMDYMKEHYAEDVKIGALADLIGVNRSYLTSRFKILVGCSPQKFLANLRIEKAKFLLKKTDMSISSVASAVGYTDQLAFSKIFKQRCGQSPRMYRGEKSELIVMERKGYLAQEKM